MRIWLRRIRNILLLLLLAVLAFEGMYRYQVVDTYRSEYEHLNRHPFPQNPRAKVLVMGDSFTAMDDGYVDQLRRDHPDIAFYNAAIPGTGPIQATYTAPRRFRQAEPDALIYQIYLGNDLFDIRNPVAWSKTSFLRNVYWLTSNSLRSIGWLNYKLGQFRSKPSVDAKEEIGAFSPDLYNARDKRYFQIDPSWLADQLSLGENWEGDVLSYLAYLKDLLEMAEEKKIPVLLLVVPHCAQLGGEYAENMEKLGMNNIGTVTEALPDWLFAIGSTAKGYPQTEVAYLLEDLKAAEDTLGPLYFPNDPHLRPEGYAILAKRVSDWLEYALP